MKKLLLALLAVVLLMAVSPMLITQSQYIHDDGAESYLLKVRQATFGTGDYHTSVKVLDVTNDDNDALLRVWGAADGSTVNANGFMQSAVGFRIGADQANGPGCFACTTWTRGAGAPAAGTCNAASVGSVYSRVDAPDDAHLIYVCGTAGWVAK